MSAYTFAFHAIIGGKRWELDTVATNEADARRTIRKGFAWVSRYQGKSIPDEWVVLDARRSA